MITKIELIELIEHRLQGEARTKNLGKLHRKIIEYNIGRAYNESLRRMMANGYVDLGNFTKEYENVAVSYDTTTRKYYSVLPEKIVAINKPASGIYDIFIQEGTGVNDSFSVSSTDLFTDNLQFVPMDNNRFRIMDGLDINTIDDVIGYTYKNYNVYYNGSTTYLSQLSSNAGVRMLLVIPFEQYADTDDINIPFGDEEMLMERVVNFMIGTPDSDNVNNNNSVNLNNQGDGRK
jgi:hypothetical protein